MSGERYIKQAIIAALCEHPDQEKYKAKAFLGDNLSQMLDALSTDRVRLTKADFFTADDDGRFIIDTPGFWRNYDRIFKLLKKNGETFGAEDFLKPLNTRAGSPSLLASAETHGGLVRLFRPEYWVGRFDESEGLWYKLSVGVRQKHFKSNGQIPLDMKRQMLAAEGRSAPEDSLLAAGVTPEQLFSIGKPNGASLDDIIHKLKKNGDFLRKEYLLLTDNVGDTLFCYDGAWKQYEKIVDHLLAHGQRLEAADLTRVVGDRNSIMTRAAENNALHKIFTPHHWAGHLSGMLDLWENMKPAWDIGETSSFEFDVKYAKAEDLTHAPKLNGLAIASAADLVKPVATEEGASVLPLGLKSVWDHLDPKAQTPVVEGLKLSHLRAVSGALGHTCLMTAAKLGHFAKVVEIARKSGEALLVDDFLKEDCHGNSLLDVLANQNQLHMVFTPAIWTGRLTEMQALWASVKLSDRTQVDIQQAEVAVKQATLGQGNRPRFRPGGPK